MSTITTHVLDLTLGRPASGVPVRLEFHGLEGDWVTVSDRRTDHDGRIGDLSFEEACAKTLSKLTGRPGGFDPDSPYWIVPNALSLARRMSIDESEITKIVAG